ncbi:uncharacterized protein BCN122_II3057 [Burkholderia cenocepacia]|nr:uncharacterized protein BCN122_II3057 [Burkholderia cenocepacia]
MIRVRGRTIVRCLRRRHQTGARTSGFPLRIISLARKK